MAIYLWEIDQKEIEAGKQLLRNKDLLSIIDKKYNKPEDRDQYH